METGRRADLPDLAEPGALQGNLDPDFIRLRRSSLVDFFQCVSHIAGLPLPATAVPTEGPSRSVGMTPKGDRFLYHQLVSFLSYSDAQSPRENAPSTSLAHVADCEEEDDEEHDTTPNRRNDTSLLPPEEESAGAVLIL